MTWRPWRADAGRAAGALVAALLGCSAGTTRAQMVCLTTPYPEQRPIQDLVTRDARRALDAAHAAMTTLRAAPSPDAGRLAALYALEAQSYSMLEFDAEARTAAHMGLTLAARPDDPVHVNLLLTDAENVYDEAGQAAALDSIEAARRAQRPGSMTDTCLLITQGLLHMRSNHPELALAPVMQAYRASNAPGMADQKVLAAGTLSSVMATLGDLDQALALNQNYIDWATTHRATLSLSISTFLRGKLLASKGEFPAALESFNRARALSVQLNDPQGVAFADLMRCEALSEQRQYEPARAPCGSALRRFTASHSTDVVKEARSLLARIELEERHPARALAILNGVLDHRGTDMYARRVAPAYLWRARAHAALGHDRAAYADLTEYLRRYQASNDAERQRAALAQQARLDLTLKDQELRRVQAEARNARLEVSRQALLRNLALVSAALASAIALFAAWIWRRRHEAQGIRQAAEERVAALGRLTGGIAHEFNNLLTVIQQAGGLLARSAAARSDPGAAGLVAEIQQASSVCAEITMQLLSFARQQNLRPETIAMDLFLAEMLPTLEKLADPKIVIRVDCERPAPAVHADRRQLMAALMNLVANARDASAPAGPVTVRVAGDGPGWTRIEVSDDGCGMSAEVRAHAAEPFYSTKALGSGSGLGLSVVDGFARQSGGSMTLSSAPQRGTTVSLRLPSQGPAS